MRLEITMRESWGGGESTITVSEYFDTIEEIKPYIFEKFMQGMQCETYFDEQHHERVIIYDSGDVYTFRMFEGNERDGAS